MRRIGLLSALCAVIGAATALGGCGIGPGITGNDTGGIIPWSPENQHNMRAFASQHCARYNKTARITVVHARYGDYIGFDCRWQGNPLRYRQGPIVSSKG
jgi:hypothetical protein